MHRGWRYPQSENKESWGCDYEWERNVRVGEILETDFRDWDSLSLVAMIESIYSVMRVNRLVRDLTLLYFQV